MYQIAFVLAALFLSGCAASQVPALVQCKLDALRVLPKDPMQVTFADGVDLVERIQACEAGSDAVK
jgi:hypothetical protein